MKERQKSSRAAKGTGSIRKITTSKNGKTYTYWQGRYTAGYDPGTGEQIQRTISGKTQKEVTQKLKQALHEIDQGNYIAPSKMTLGEWLDIWQENYLSSIKESSAHVYREIIRLYLSPSLGAVKLEALCPHTIQIFYNNLHKPKEKEKAALSPKTIKNVHGVLRKALQQAVAANYLRFNPADACILPRVVRKEIQPLSEEQIAAFLSAIVGHRHEYLYRIALFTGIREGEILGLTWDCVDDQNGTLLIKQQLKKERQKGGAYYLAPPKNDKTRSLTVAPSVLQQFRLQKLAQNKMRVMAGDAWTDSDLVFTNEIGAFLSYRTVYDCFKRVVSTIGVPTARFHDLRHTYSVASLQSGDDIKTVQENLGHATAAFTLDVYGHVSARMKQESAQRMESFIQSVSAPRGQ